MRKLEEGEADATLLAAAGLDRLGQIDIGVPIPVEIMLPAPAQGAIGIETLTGNDKMRALLAAIDHHETSACVHVERALLEGLRADCRSPVAALAEIRDGQLFLRAEILSPEGSERVAEQAIVDDRAKAHALAEKLLDRVSPALRALFGP